MEWQAIYNLNKLFLLNNFWKTLSIHFIFDVYVCNIKTQVKFHFVYKQPIVDGIFITIKTHWASLSCGHISSFHLSTWQCFYTSTSY